MQLNKSIGTSWTDSCSAEGWPLPIIEWLFNGKKIINNNNNNNENNSTNENSIDLVGVQVINHHRHLIATSYILINSLTRSHNGRYSCIINGNISIKNVTLSLSIDDNTKKSIAFFNKKSY